MRLFMYQLPDIKEGQRLFSCYSKITKNVLRENASLVSYKDFRNYRLFVEFRNNQV